MHKKWIKYTNSCCHMSDHKEFIKSSSFDGVLNPKLILWQMLEISDMQDEWHAWFFSKLPFPVLRPYLRPVGVALLLGGCCSTEAAWSPIHCIASSLPKAARQSHRSPRANVSLICQEKEAVWLVAKVTDRVRLAEKGGDGGLVDRPWVHGSWPWWEAAAACTLLDAPLWNSSHSLWARDYDWGLDVPQHLLCLVLSPDKYVACEMFSIPIVYTYPHLGV